MWLCECGRSFDNKYSRATHRKWCEVYNHGISPFKEKMLKINAENSEKNRSLWNDSEHREKISKAVSDRLHKSWKDPEYRKSQEIRMRNSSLEFWKDPNYAKIHSDKCKNNFSNILHRYLKSYKGNINSRCYVYLVKFDDSIKVGFCNSLKGRLYRLKPKELINLIEFDNIEKGLRYEYEFHQSHKELMLSNEYYPIEELDNINKEFINYNRSVYYE